MLKIDYKIITLSQFDIQKAHRPAQVAYFCMTVIQVRTEEEMLLKAMLFFGATRVHLFILLKTSQSLNFMPSFNWASFFVLTRCRKAKLSPRLI